MIDIVCVASDCYVSAGVPISSKRMGGTMILYILATLAIWSILAAFAATLQVRQ